MGNITAITAQKNNKKRANIFVDGEYRCSLDKMSVISFGLKEGTEIDNEKFTELIKDSEQKSAFDSAVKFLCVRMRAEAEVVRYLQGKKFSEDSIAHTVEKLKEYGYIDDEKFGKAYIKSYNQKYGGKKLIYELGRLGVSEDIVQRLIGEDGGDEYAAAEKAAEKYIRTHSGKSINAAKLAAFLYGRGFSGEVCRRTSEKYAANAYREE